MERWDPIPERYCSMNWNRHPQRLLPTPFQREYRYRQCRRNDIVQCHLIKVFSQLGSRARMIHPRLPRRGEGDGVIGQWLAVLDDISAVQSVVYHKCMKIPRQVYTRTG